MYYSAIRCVHCVISTNCIFSSLASPGSYLTIIKLFSSVSLASFPLALRRRRHFLGNFSGAFDTGSSLPMPCACCFSNYYYHFFGVDRFTFMSVPRILRRRHTKNPEIEFFSFSFRALLLFFSGLHPGALFLPPPARSSFAADSLVNVNICCLRRSQSPDSFSYLHASAEPPITSVPREAIVASTGPRKAFCRRD